MLVHFPITLWTGAVVSDLGGWISGHPAWWTASLICNALGIVTAAVAMLLGFLDYISLGRQHPAQDTAVMHMLAMSGAWLLFLTSLALRGLAPESPSSIGSTALALVAWITMALGGWLGGRLVYRFGAGVSTGR